MKSLVVGVVIALAGTAHAQPVQHDEVSEDTALGLALGGTVASWGAVIVGGKMGNDGLATAGAIGTLIAPSFGHWYSHQIFTRGLGLRALGVGVAIVAFGMAWDASFTGEDDDEDTAGVLLLVGAGMYVAGTVDDIATAGAAARKYNARFRDVTVVPTANANGGGLSLVGRF